MVTELTATYHINVTGDCADRMKSLRLSQGGRDIRDGNDNMTQELIITTISEPHTFEVTGRDPQRMKYFADTYKLTATTLTFIEVNPMAATHTLITLEGVRFNGYDHSSGWGDLQMSTLRGLCNTITYADTSNTEVTPFDYDPA